MRAFKAALQLIAQRAPDDASAKTLADLVFSLESDSGFLLSRLYELDPSDFDLAMRVLSDWRLDRYYASRARLIDI